MCACRKTGSLTDQELEHVLNHGIERGELELGEGGVYRLTPLGLDRAIRLVRRVRFDANREVA